MTRHDPQNLVNLSLQINRSNTGNADLIKYVFKRKGVKYRGVVRRNGPLLPLLLARGVDGTNIVSITSVVEPITDQRQIDAARSHSFALRRQTVEARSQTMGTA